MINVLIPLANGVEEMEAVIVIDTLRRAKWTVLTAGIHPGVITGSRGVRLIPDANWNEIDPDSFDILVLPGGSEGTNALSGDKRVLETIRNFMQNEKTIAAICAAPLALQSAGVLKDRKVTCHPAVAGQLTQTTRLNDRVVIDGGLITSQGVGSALEFALAIVQCIEGQEKTNELARSMLVDT